MDKEEIIEGIIDRLIDGFSDYAIEEFLTRKGVNPQDFATFIQIANEKLLAERLRIYPKQHKLAFSIWLLATIVFCVLFFFVIPKQNITSGVWIISIFGAICISFSGLKAIQYNNSWTTEYIEKYGKPGFDWSAVFAISFLPVLILSFIINTIFSSNADNILKLTQEDAIATVINGSSVEGKINYASITVKFTTKDGIEMVVEEDLSTYDFNKFYEGQQINIVYSKDNPRNIDLLIDDKTVREFKGSEERKIEVNDLLVLMNTKKNKNDMLKTLNNICIGWTFNPNEAVWMNERRQTVIKYDSEVLMFFSNSLEQKILFSRDLMALGFKKAEKGVKMAKFGLSDEVLENDKYIFSLRTVSIEGQVSLVVEVYKKL